MVTIARITAKDNYAFAEVIFNSVLTEEEIKEEIAQECGCNTDAVLVEHIMYQ